MISLFFHYYPYSYQVFCHSCFPLLLYRNKKIKYIKGNTQNIVKILSKYKKNIKVIFHFGEFSRIFQSFKKFYECYESNSIGSKEVFKFCLENKIVQFEFFICFSIFCLFFWTGLVNNTNLIRNTSRLSPKFFCIFFFYKIKK